MQERPSTEKSREELREELESLRAQVKTLREREDSWERQHERNARLIVDGMYQFAAVLDDQGRMVDVNLTALQEGGARREDVIGKYVWQPPWMQVSNEVVEQVRRDVQTAASGQFVRHELEAYGAEAGAEIIIVDFSLNPIHDEDGNLWIIAEGRNITERKRAEAQVERKTEELRQAHEQLKEFDRLKSEFFANVSHELRTPLMLILGPIRRQLENADLSPQLREDLQVVDRNAGLLLQQVNNLLDLAKLEASGLKLDYAQFDLAQLMRLVVGYFDGLAAEHHLRYELDVPEALNAQLDADKVQRIVLNLLSNAFKFTPDGGEIRCRAQRRDDQAVVVVEDSGPGVPEHLREAIFDRFRQAEGGAAREVGGTGLGLSITREFVELHGGRITVDRAPIGGARFEVQLPICAPEDAQVNESAELFEEERGRRVVDELRSYRPRDPERSNDSPPLEGERPLVLVVEDNPDMNAFIADALSSRYRVARAYDGREGLQKARRVHPELIVTDIMMPAVSGDQMIEKLRQDPEFREIPVVVLTAKADADQRVDLLEAGVEDHVTKPFEADELIARVDGLIQRRRTTIRKLRQVNAQLETALESARVAREQAERASKYKSDFLSLVSHELRTPLASLRLQIERMQLADSQLPADLGDLVERMDLQSQRLHELIEGLLNYTQIQSGRLSVELEYFDVGTVAAECREEIQPQADAKGLQLQLDVADDPPRLRSDRRLVRLIVVNLLTNAIKFTDHGAVTLSVAPAENQKGTVRIDVTDTGPGIPLEQQQRIFEPFEQLEMIRRKNLRGIGLGLALVRELVRSLDGTIGVDSTPGEGSTFSVVFKSVGEQ